MASHEKKESPSSNDRLLGEDTRSKAKRALEKFLEFIFTNLLPIGLIIAIIFGTFVSSIGTALNHPAISYICLIGIFLISGLFMKTEEMMTAVKAIRAIVWSFLSILFISCIIGTQIIGYVNFETVDGQSKDVNTTGIHSGNISDKGQSSLVGKSVSLQMGMQIFFLMPCTVSTGVVMVNQLGGSDVLALLLTVVSNIIGVLTIAPMFTWLISSGQQSSVKLDILSFLQKSLLTILIPVVGGKCLQFITFVKILSTKYKKILKTISVLLLVLLVFVKISIASNQGLMKLLSVADIFTIIGVFLGVHCILLIMNSIVSLILRIPKEQIKCVTILCSQKTMAVAVAVLSFLPNTIIDEGLGTIAVIICHLSMILFDSFLVSIWLYIEKYINKDSGEYLKI